MRETSLPYAAHTLACAFSIREHDTDQHLGGNSSRVICGNISQATCDLPESWRRAFASFCVSASHHSPRRRRRPIGGNGHCSYNRDDCWRGRARGRGRGRGGRWCGGGHCHIGHHRHCSDHRDDCRRGRGRGRHWGWHRHWHLHAKGAIFCSDAGLQPWQGGRRASEENVAQSHNFM